MREFLTRDIELVCLRNTLYGNGLPPNYKAGFQTQILLQYIRVYKSTVLLEEKGEGRVETTPHMHF